MPILMDADGQPCTGDIDFQETINLGFLKYEGPVDPKITGGFENTFKIPELDVQFLYQLPIWQQGADCMIISRASILI